MKNVERTRVAVVGASGYTGEELVRLLLRHPRAELTAVTSRQLAGKSLSEVFPRVAHHATAQTLQFTDAAPAKIADQADIVFLALPHGVAVDFAGPLLQAGARVIDLSADFRIRSPETYREFYAHEHRAPDLLPAAVYGLPEIYREQICAARLVACPGCYPTSILLPMIPLLRERLVEPGSIIANSLSGVSGAGRKAEVDYLFVECNESARAYGVPKHRHLAEIEQELSIAAGKSVAVQFTPHLIPVNRGILTTIYAAPTSELRSAESGVEFAERIEAALRAAYADEPFVRLLGGKVLPDTKNVVGSNFIEIAWRLDSRTGRLIVMSAEDNILKGASGQAIQCFNIMSGYAESEGLI
ncbi:MAG: N-acetyl-gamma-glutamyl-phosphate reductase [Chthoniobacterales bacterium]|nr:MAG: N-acetyl-gamma-glutamyl-phosphate reductase [Chthoniobacterales bacterium]